MPTKHRRHAITETPQVKQALDPLRAELNGERLDLAELVILGAEAKLSHLRTDREESRARVRGLTDRIRRGEVHLDPALADEVKRLGLPD